MSGRREDFLPNITYTWVDEDHPSSPSYVYVNGEWLGSLKTPETTQEVMKMLQNAYLTGVQNGKRIRSAELRGLLEI